MGAPTPKVCGQLSPENCMKIKEMEPRGECIPSGSLGSANVNDLTKAYLIQQSHTGADTGFSVGGGANPLRGGGANIQICQIFRKNCMKSRKFWSIRGGGLTPGAPP